MEGKRGERRAVKQRKQMKERNVRQNEKELIAIKNKRRGKKQKFVESCRNRLPKIIIFYFYFLYQNYFFYRNFDAARNMKVISI
jgi:hypothetical protein